MMFCAAEAEVRGDSMLGTAPPQARVLLVQQPGPWGPRGLRDSRCDPDVARRIDVAAARAGMRLQTVRRPGQHERGIPAGGYLIGIADARPGAEATTWWRTDDLAEIAAELESDGRPSRLPVATETTALYLVCAHGKHDPCCAVRGRPLAEALERVRPGRVWETTHLGGDRFAANLLVLPTGELYGRVSPAAAAGIVDTVDAGDVIAHRMRGRIGLPPFAQAALAFAHEQLGIAARAALAVTNVEKTAPDRARVDLRTPRGAVVVTVVAETTEPAQLTCHGRPGVRARAYRGLEIAAADQTMRS